MGHHPTHPTTKSESEWEYMVAPGTPKEYMVQIEASSTHECQEGVLGQGGQQLTHLHRSVQHVPNLSSGLVPIDPGLVFLSFSMLGSLIFFLSFTTYELKVPLLFVALTWILSEESSLMIGRRERKFLSFNLITAS